MLGGRPAIVETPSGCHYPLPFCKSLLFGNRRCADAELLAGPLKTAIAGNTRKVPNGGRCAFFMDELFSSKGENYEFFMSIYLG